MDPKLKEAISKLDYDYRLAIAIYREYRRVIDEAMDYIIEDALQLLAPEFPGIELVDFLLVDPD